MERKEKSHIPKECQHCKQADCYNCGFAAKRWALSKKDGLLSLRALKMRAIARYQRQIDEIDRKLQAFERME